MTISGVNGSLQFFPNDFAFNDYQIVNIAYHLDDNVIAGLGTTVALDNVVEIQTDSVDCTSGRTTVVSVANTVRSMKVHSTITNIRQSFLK